MEWILAGSRNPSPFFVTQFLKGNVLLRVHEVAALQQFKVEMGIICTLVQC